MKIGFIGLGKMGLPIAKRMVAAGHEIIAYVRNDAGRERAKAAGFAYTNKVSGVCEGTDIVIASISDDAALREIVFGSDGLGTAMQAGQTLIETSTVSIEASEAVAKVLEARKAGYLRSPVSGSTVLAEAGTLTAMISGPRAEFDRLMPIFTIFSAKQYYVGEKEQGRVIKLVANAMVGATSALVAEVLAFAQKGGLEVPVTLEVLCNSVVATPLLGYKRDLINAGKFDPNFSVSQMMKDMDLILSVGRFNHVPMPLTSSIREQYEAAFAHGLGEKDFFVLVKEMRDRAGLKS